MYSIIAKMMRGSRAFRSKPPPACQNRRWACSPRPTVMSRQPTRRVPAHVLDGPGADRLLYRFEDVADVVYLLIGPNEKMNVLGHENVGPQQKVELPARLVHRIRQPLAGGLGAEELKAVKARKGKFMGMAGLIGRRPAHASLPPVHTDIQVNKRYPG